MHQCVVQRGEQPTLETSVTWMIRELGCNKLNQLRENVSDQEYTGRTPSPQLGLINQQSPGVNIRQTVQKKNKCNLASKLANEIICLNMILILLNI